MYQKCWECTKSWEKNHKKCLFWRDGCMKSMKSLINWILYTNLDIFYIFIELFDKYILEDSWL